MNENFEGVPRLSFLFHVRSMEKFYWIILLHHCNFINKFWIKYTYLKAFLFMNRFKTFETHGTYFQGKDKELSMYSSTCALWRNYFVVFGVFLTDKIRLLTVIKKNLDFLRDTVGCFYIEMDQNIDSKMTQIQLEEILNKSVWFSFTVLRY